MTDAELQPFRLIPCWKYDQPSDSFYIGRGSTERKTGNMGGSTPKQRMAMAA
jgi:hypothetical protein